jgi:hypothetical protein
VVTELKDALKSSTEEGRTQMARRKQQRIPGTEPASIKELDDAAEAYVEARDARMSCTEVEVVAKAALIAAMKKHGVEVYKDESSVPALVVTVVPGKDNVKVSRVDGDDDEAEEDEVP